MPTGSTPQHADQLYRDRAVTRSPGCCHLSGRRRRPSWLSISTTNMPPYPVRGGDATPLPCRVLACTQNFTSPEPPTPPSGVPGFTEQAIKFALGEGHRTMAGVQALSGTGSLRIAGELLNMYRPGAKVLLPTPTWGNHLKIFAQSRVETAQYAYYDPATISLDFAGMVRDIKEAPDGSVVLLHACAHNPTGVDPSREQWQELSEVVKAKGHIPLFDSAYQGFASGDAEADAYSMRLFAEQGHPIILCQSFSKNFGLYGQRVGAVSVAAEDAEEAERLTSQLKAIARAMYSNPPLHGARLVMRVLDNPALEAEWRGDCAAMAARIQGMRTALKDALHEAGSTMNWDHITSQIGMFCYSGMTPEEVQRLKAEHHIYLTSNGRISMAGVTSGNVKYLAECIHEVTTKLRQ